MMKKFISAVVAAVMSMSVMAVVLADNNPTVYVDNAEVVFPDQKAEIVDDRTLVPVRGIFEMIGANVKWDGDTRTVQIDSSDNRTRVYLTIDDEVMKLYKFKDIFSSDETLITLDVAPQILNDRTMVPLRAISEALGTDVVWDADAYAVYISTESAPAADDNTSDSSETPVSGGNGGSSTGTSTGSATPAPLVIAKPAISLSASADAVSEGDTFDVYINLSNMPKDSYVNTVTALLKYDKENFEYQDFTLFANGEDVNMVLGGDSSGYDSYSEGIKITAIVDGDSINTDGTVAKLTFKALTGNGGEIALVNSYEMVRGYNTVITVKQSGESIELAGKDAVVNTTPLVISAK